MASDDFDVIAKKALSYIMARAKADVVPSVAKAKEVAGCGNVYWAMVVGSMLDDGLIKGACVDSCYDGTTDVSGSPAFGITQKGARYLKDNSAMREAGRFLGKAFADLLPVAVETTKTLMA